MQIAVELQQFEVTKFVDCQHVKHVYYKISSQSADVRIEQHWVIRYCAHFGLTVKQTLDEMESVYGTNLLPRRTIQRWNKQFRNSRTSAESNHKAGEWPQRMHQCIASEGRYFEKKKAQDTLEDDKDEG